MKRLEAVCSRIKRCNVFADIGCDHGRISLYVLKNALADEVIAADISEASLEKARKLLVCFRGVRFIVSDGFSALPSVDEAVIAGMGGLTIQKILLDSAQSCRLILAPQNHAEALRVFLASNGYKITEDFLAVENKKFYDIIVAEPGRCVIDGRQARFGAFYQEGGALLKEKLKRQLEKLQNFRTHGQNEMLLAELKEVLHCIQ